MVSLPDVFVMLVSGLFAGLIGTAGGIASLVSYPALLAIGVPTLTANVTNLVAVTSSWPGSALASREELRGRRRWVERYALLAGGGSLVGSVLLLSTSAGVFRHIVPFLVAGGSLTLWFSPQLTARHAARGPRASGLLLTALLPVISIYNGYFGAGSGVMTLALLLITTDQRLPVANALKNMLIGAATAVCAVVLAIFGPVDWGAAVPLGIGMFAGGTIGPRIARRLPAGLFRAIVVLIGLGLAVQLLISGGA